MQNHGTAYRYCVSDFRSSLWFWNCSLDNSGSGTLFMTPIVSLPGQASILLQRNERSGTMFETTISCFLISPPHLQLDKHVPCMHNMLLHRKCTTLILVYCLITLHLLVELNQLRLIVWELILIQHHLKKWTVCRKADIRMSDVWWVLFSTFRSLTSLCWSVSVWWEKQYASTFVMEAVQYSYWNFVMRIFLGFMA